MSTSDSNTTFHDVANLLTSILAASHTAAIDIEQACKMGQPDGPLASRLSSARESIFLLQHTGQLIAHVMGASRTPRTWDTATHDGATALDEALELAAAAAGPILSDRVQIHIDRCPDAIVSGNRNDLAMVFFNLFLNAHQAICQDLESTGHIEVSVAQKRSRVCIKIRDNGPGMSDQQLLKAFRSGYSSRGGMGLGLAICSQTVARCGGHMQIRSDDGLEVAVVLPLAPTMGDVSDAVRLAG